MTGTEGIQIYVACHKPTCVLDNRLLVPVQVGAALTDIDMTECVRTMRGNTFLKKILSTVN